MLRCVLELWWMVLQLRANGLQLHDGTADSKPFIYIYMYRHSTRAK